MSVYIYLPLQPILTAEAGLVGAFSCGFSGIRSVFVWLRECSSLTGCCAEHEVTWHKTFHPNGMWSIGKAQSTIIYVHCIG